MEPLPKIVRDRMQASRSASHPDPDLLTAFAEKDLGSRERLQVMDHLATCAECREVVSLAIPEGEVVPARPAPVKAGSWLRWPVLRWGAVAACVVVVGAAVSIYRSSRPIEGYTELRRDERAAPPPQAAPQSAQTQVAESVPAAPKGETRLQATLEQPQKAAAPKAIAEDKKYAAGSGAGYGVAGKLAAPPVPAAVPPTRARTDQFSLASNAKEAAPTQAAPARILNAPSPQTEMVMVVPAPAQPAKSAERQKAKAEAGANAGSVSQTVEVTAAAPAVDTGQLDLVLGQRTEQAKAMSASPQAAKSAEQQKPEARAAGTKVGSASETVEVSNEVVAVEADTATELRKQKLEAQKKDIPVAGRDVVQLQAAQPRFVPKPLTQTADSTVGGPKMLDAIQSAKWTLSDDGLPQRSLDSGKTWEKVQVDHTSGFRALSALGLEVWVGGPGGLLYHSDDIGLHWTRVTPVADAVALAADIVRIEFTDSLHGKLTTADHHTWFTSDGGKTWQRN